MNAEAISESLEIDRVFHAPIERVFDAWTNPQLLAQWFGPENFEVMEVEADCRPGGKYSIIIVSPDNQNIKHFGEYLEVKKPNKLIFTWVLNNQACQGSTGHTTTTIVEINFVQQGDVTLLQLRHDKLPDRTAVDGHSMGWQSSFMCLDAFLVR